jgi:hypothetical protein
MWYLKIIKEIIVGKLYVTIAHLGGTLHNGEWSLHQISLDQKCVLALDQIFDHYIESC